MNSDKLNVLISLQDACSGYLVSFVYQVLFLTEYTVYIIYMYMRMYEEMTCRFFNLKKNIVTGLDFFLQLTTRVD